MNIETPILLTLFGLKPEKLESDKFIVSRGWCASLDGARVVRFPGDTIVDLTTIGLNGRDRPAAEGRDEFIYVIENQDTGEAGFIVSPSRFYGPGSESVIYPTGFVPVRKLMFGVKYKSAHGGIPNYHIAHWPMPRIRLTDAEDSPVWRPIHEYSSGSAWVPVDLSPYMPDNARMALLSINITATGSAGSAYIRSHGGQSYGIKVASVNPGVLPAFATMWEIRPDSLRKIQVKTIGGARMSIVVIGYDMTEYS